MIQTELGHGRDAATLFLECGGATPRLDGLVGRTAEFSILRGLIDSIPDADHTFVVLGEAGIGKTAILDAVSEYARSIGMLVLSTTGRESETNLPFAAIHALLRPIMDSVSGLSERQRSALRAAVGMESRMAEEDGLVIAKAVLTLLSDVAHRRPLLIVADDAHWIDSDTVDLLNFVGHRVDSESIIIVFSARQTENAARLDRRISQLYLRPLSPEDAGTLLDCLGNPLGGYARTQVLTQAAGNPMALTELSKLVADDPTLLSRWATNPLPLDSRLRSVLAARLNGLSESTQAALLYAAIADTSDLSECGSGGPVELDSEALEPAERLGLVALTPNGLQFSHPLLRSAVYHGSSFASRAAAHRRLAENVQLAPDRRAWHLASATLGPNEEVAALLEDTAADAQRRGGTAAAALALERSAELSANRDGKARRLMAGAALAFSSGQKDWVHDLATRALAVTTQKDLRLMAQQKVGWSLSLSNAQLAALPTLTSVAREALDHDLVLAWNALALAATVLHNTGGPTERQTVRETYELLEGAELGHLSADLTQQVQAHRLYSRTALGSSCTRDEDVQLLRLISPNALRDTTLQALAETAWMLDESELSIALFSDLLQRLRKPDVRGTNMPALAIFGWALTDAGRWHDAIANVATVERLAAGNGLELVTTSADLSLAFILAWRGDLTAARTRIDAAIKRLDTRTCRATAARAYHALGIAALAEGNSLMAYSQLNHLFSDDGEPLHHHLSYLGVADLAVAAAQADRRMEARRLLERAFAVFASTPSPRVTQLRARAMGVLAEPEEAGAHFEIALSDPSGTEWPYERAHLQLEYGEWLRRRKRMTEARTNLLLALDTFEGLGAAPAVVRARAELQACGNAAQTTPGTPSKLTPQEHQIVRLAASGLTNREIGERLHLSPRTVSSHLYRSFPKLGIASRHQLRDVMAAAGLSAVQAAGVPLASRP